jgi:hypothetical protein
VGDYHHTDVFNQQEDHNEAIMLAEAEAAHSDKVDEAVEQSNWDNLMEEGNKLDGGEGTLATDFLRPQRERRGPAQDKYFLSLEANVGDPLLNEDPAGNTTDTEEHPRDDWNEEDDDDFDPDEDVEDIEMVQRDHCMS